MTRNDVILHEKETNTLKQEIKALIADKRGLLHLLSCAPAVTYSFEAKGDFRPTFLSKNFKGLFGYEPREYMTDSNFVRDRVHPDDAQHVQNELSRLFNAGHLTLEYRFLCKDDHYCWVSDEMRLILDKKGEPLEVVGTWSDITKKKQIADALTEAQSRLSHVLAASPAVIYSFEAKENFGPTFISENIKQVFGYEPREYLEDPKFMPLHTHPDDLRRIAKEWPHLFKEGHHVNEYRFLCKDGTHCWVSDQLHLVRDKDGEPVEIVGAMTIITALKKAEEELLMAMNRLDYLMTSAPAVTYCFEARGDYLPTFISQNVKDLLGYEPEEYLADRNFVPSRIHPDDAQRVQNELSRLFNVGHLVEEYRFLCKDGHYCWVSDEMRVIRNESGEPLEVVGSWSDITKKKQMAEELEKAHAQIKAELEIARAMQIAILPENFPSAPGCHGAARMLPATTMGGDFYDFMVLPDGRIGLVIADVSGKGVPAAFFMAVARTTLRSLAFGSTGPGECLKKANNVLCVQNPMELFVTVFYGVFDPATGLLIYANGGHNPPLLRHADGPVEALAAPGGMVLGALPDIEYRENVIQFTAGDRLVLYTDGVTEAFDPELHLYDEQRFIVNLALKGGSDAQTVLDGIFQDVTTFAGTAPQSDDITLAVIAWDPSPTDNFVI